MTYDLLKELLNMSQEKLLKIGLIAKKLRRRIIEFRYTYKDEVISTHVNAIEFVVGLVEIALELKTRAITKEEENWFRAGYYLDYVFPSGDEWYDISTLYSELVDLVTELNFFRKEN